MLVSVALRLDRARLSWLLRAAGRSKQSPGRSVVAVTTTSLALDCAGSSSGCAAVVHPADRHTPNWPAPTEVNRRILLRLFQSSKDGAEHGTCRARARTGRRWASADLDNGDVGVKGRIRRRYPNFISRQVI